MRSGNQKAGASSSCTRYLQARILKQEVSFWQDYKDIAMLEEFLFETQPINLKEDQA